ncbi:MAG: hypothetical protein ACFFDN_19020 [Candidatus Hodarchaeota archaeon]
MYNIRHIWRREFILRRKYYLDAIKKCYNTYGILIKIVGRNTISVRRHNETLIEIFRDNKCIRFIRMLLPGIKRNVRYFTRLKYGDIRIII